VKAVAKSTGSSCHPTWISSAESLGEVTLGYEQP
jgi:hypothetical protein